MTLQRLNPESPTSVDAIGYMAPYVRIATHVGFCIQWVASTSDEEWANPNEICASEERVCVDLRETLAHLNTNVETLPTAFVNQQQVDRMGAVRGMIINLIDNAPEERHEMLSDLQTLADALAYAAACFERSVTGNNTCNEGQSA